MEGVVAASRGPCSFGFLFSPPEKLLHKKPPQNAKSRALLPICIGELSLSTTHRGRALHSTILIDCFDDLGYPVCTPGINFLVEDDFRDVVRVAVYVPKGESPEMYAYRFKKGQNITIKEPFFKVAQDGNLLVRVDDIADVVEGRPDTCKERDADEWRKLGNEFFRAESFTVANKCYFQGLKTQECKDAATLLSNRAICHIKNGDFQEGLRDAGAARTVCPELVKAWYNEALSLSHLLPSKQPAINTLKEALILHPDNTILQKFLKQLEKGKKTGKRIHQKNTTEENNKWFVVVGGEESTEIGEGLMDGDKGKELGNAEFRKGNFMKAIHYYTLSLHLHSLSSSLLLLNCSAAFFRLDLFSKYNSFIFLLLLMLWLVQITVEKIKFMSCDSWKVCRGCLEFVKL